MTTGRTGDCNSQHLSRVIERAGMIPAAILRSHQGQELNVPTKGRTHDHIHRPHRANKSLATQEPSTHDIFGSISADHAVEDEVELQKACHPRRARQRRAREGDPGRATATMFVVARPPGFPSLAAQARLAGNDIFGSISADHALIANARGARSTRFHAEPQRT